MTTSLFDPISLRNVHARNRIWLAPGEEGSWTTVGPSTIPFEGPLAPEPLSPEAIQQIVTDVAGA